MDRLEAAMAARDKEISEALEEARSELVALRQRQAELEASIRRGEAALSSGSMPDKPLTLHEALEIVLRDQGNRWMHVRELSDEVNRRGLYRRRDGGEVQPNQVHARTKNYSAMFEKDGPKVRLLSAAGPVSSRVERRAKASATRSPSKYDTLRDCLRSARTNELAFSMDEIAAMVGGLPESAYEHRAWWSNDESGAHVQALAWREAGWRVRSADLRLLRVLFGRDEPGDAGTSGVREPRRPSPRSDTDAASPGSSGEGQL